jgi:hypothetical protein
LIAVFIIEADIRYKQEKRFIEGIKEGDLFVENNAEEKVSIFRDDLVFRRDVLWKVYQKDVGICLQNFHCPKITKTVYYKDLRKMKKVDQIWYRTPSYYDSVIKVIKDRAAKETYYSENI